MITLKFTLLLAINLKQNVQEKTRKSKKTKRGNSKQSASKKSKTTRSSKSSKTKKSKKKHAKDLHHKVVEPEKDYVITVGDPLACFRVEYELFHKRFKYGVDVLCWGSVAKIYTKDGSKCLKTVMKGDVAWIPIYIEHFINPLPTEDLLEFAKHIISFDIKFGKNKLVFHSSKSEKCHKFYIFEEDLREDDFVDVFETDPNFGYFVSKEEYSFKQDIKDIVIKCTNSPRDNEIVSYQHKINYIHDYQISQIIKKTSEGQEIRCREIEEQKAESKQNKKDKKKKKAKKHKKEKGSKKSGKAEENVKMNLKIPAEILFTDPTISAFKYIRENAKIYKAFILTSSDNLLTARQKNELQPMIVKIPKLSNFPCEWLKEKGFKGLYVNCKIPGVIEFRTPTKLLPDESTIHIFESRFFCTNEIPKLQILEVLQCKRVMLEVFGAKEIEIKNEKKKKVEKKKKIKDKKKKSAKGSKSSKSGKSVKGKAEQESPVPEYPLCVAMFDISSLLRNFWLFKEKGQCHNPQALIFLNNWNMYEVITLSVNEVNLLVDPHREISSPLSEESLISKGTTLKFETHFLVPQYPSIQIPDISGIFKRLLLIVFEPHVARTLINEITLHNQQYLGPGLLVHNKLVSTNTPADAENVLTGFMVDDGDNYIFYVEGLSNGFILTLVHQLMKLNYPSARVFYDSDHMFQNRIYSIFVNYVGLLTVILKMPFREIFANALVYIEGNVPIPCWKAVQKFNLIVNSSTMKSIMFSELIPSEPELISFTIEYGLQLKHKTKETLEKVVTYSFYNLEGSKLFSTTIKESEHFKI